MYQAKLTHEQRRERRRQMAEAVRAGKDLDVICREFGVGVGTIDDACREFQVVRIGKAAQRQQEIAGAIRRGMPLADVLKQYGVSQGTVIRVCDQFGVARPPTTDGPERRSEIAEAVRRGESVDDVCERFGVGRASVYSACARYGVTVPVRFAGKPFKHYEVIAALLKSDDSFSGIARAIGMDVRQLCRINRECVKAGIPVKRRRRGPRWATRMALGAGRPNRREQNADGCSSLHR